MPVERVMELDLPCKTDATALAAHLRAHAAQYFSGDAGEAVHVRLLSEEVRVSSTLYRFVVSNGEHEKRIIVKVATPDRTGDVEAREDTPPDRPRISTCRDPERRFVLEYQALACIQRHFSLMNDPRFGAIRVFEMLPSHHAFVMEVVDQPNLRQLSIREGTRRSAAGLAAVRKAFNHSGAWLRAFHAMTTRATEEDLLTQRSDFIRYTEALTTYLASRGGDRSFLLELNTSMALRAREDLPDELPIGVSHGDFATRNILVGAGQKVTVLDSLARYRTPIYRDIGCFLANLYCSSLPALARGAVLHPGRIPAYRELFLQGYFGHTPCPDNTVRLYEAQALLERWSSMVWRYSMLQGMKRTALYLTQPLLSAFYRAAIESTLSSRSKVLVAQAAAPGGGLTSADRPTADAAGQQITPTTRQKEIVR
jgi:Phosphotransferase enzyme family